MAKEKNKTELPQVVEGELKARLIILKLNHLIYYPNHPMSGVICVITQNLVTPIMTMLKS